MYDTCVLKSPEIEKSEVPKISEFCIKYEGLDLATGEIMYSITSGKLEGSYDYRIRIELTDKDWIKEGQTPEKVTTYWHIEVECSLHKLLMNHNCYGGPCDIKKSIAYLVRFLENVMSVKLPDYMEWEVYQIDVSKIFKFQDEKICKKIMSNLKNAYYSRRRPQIFDTSVLFPGSTTTNKFYWKGPEYKTHDYKRMQKYIKRGIDNLQGKDDFYDLEQSRLTPLFMKNEQILNKAMRIIRFECSIKTRKLKELFGKDTVQVKDLNDCILHNCMEKELRKLIREDEENDMDIVRRSDLVLERLLKVKGREYGKNLYSTWTQLVQFGQQQTKETMSKPTFYRHLKDLEECGCSWNCTAVNLKPFSIVPADFSFLNSNYVCDEVDPEVITKLEAVA
jgi:phage/plasmid replication protein, gene II/X family